MYDGLYGNRETGILINFTNKYLQELEKIYTDMYDFLKPHVEHEGYECKFCKREDKLRVLNLMNDLRQTIRLNSTTTHYVCGEKVTSDVYDDSPGVMND